MNKPCARITLDLQQASTHTFVAVKKSDIGREIRITLSDGGFPYEISADCYAVLTGTKPDGNILYNHCDIEGNTIVYEITEQTTAAAGRMKAEVKLYGADDILVTSATFRIIIDGTVYTDDKVESSSEFSALRQLMSQVLEIIKNNSGEIGGGISITIVKELPTEDISTKTLYLVKDAAAPSNIYTEYMYVNGEWEIIGSQQLNLSGYVKTVNSTGPDGNGNVDVVGISSVSREEPIGKGTHTTHIQLTNGDTIDISATDGEDGTDGFNGSDGAAVYLWDSSVGDLGAGRYDDSGVTLPNDKYLKNNDILISNDGNVYLVTNYYLASFEPVFQFTINSGSGGNAENGEDGFSPIATVTQTEAGAVISITDVIGTTTATITNGKNGTDGAKGDKGDKGDAGTQGEPGKDGANGKDGTSVTHRWNGTTLTVTSASGTSSADLKGAKGDKGDKGDSIKGDTGVDGVSPTVAVSKSGKVTTISITDKNGTKTATINDGADGEDGKDATAADAVPAYWQTSIDEGVEAINTALFAAGRNKSAFLFYSDAHWNYGSQMAPTLLKYLYNHTGMTKTFFGGDIVNNEADDYDTMKYLWNWRNQLKGLPNHHSVVGNHDDGNSTNNLFSEQYVYGYLLSAEETPDMVVGDNGLYYYIDNPAEKTRYLCLDTAYKGVDSDQTTFITEALKTTPANWHIVVVAHIWFQPDYTQSSVRPIPITGLDSGASTVATLLDSYNARSGDFANCAAWVEFCIGGHVHIDYDGQTPGGIPIILVETDSQHIRSTLSYTAGTTTESSVNGIVADYDNGKIHVVRIGRGESREITVSDTVVSYTNVLPLSLAADGASVYNADGTPGYKANTRWSQSSQAEQDRDGQYITGWIPLKQYDVLRFKNMTMGSDITILYADSPGSTAGSVDYDTAANWNGVSDDSGNLVQFEWMNTQPYIRIQCTYIGPDSIITINEPID